MILRRQRRVGRLVPVAIEILALKVEARHSAGHAVLVGHRQEVNAIALEELLRVGFGGWIRKCTSKISQSGWFTCSPDGRQPLLDLRTQPLLLSINLELYPECCS